MAKASSVKLHIINLLVSEGVQPLDRIVSELLIQYGTVTEKSVLEFLLADMDFKMVAGEGWQFRDYN